VKPILIFFLLTKFKAAFFIKLWFFAVVVIALSLALYAILPNSENIALFILILSIPFAYFKIYKRNLIIHFYPPSVTQAIIWLQ